MMPTMDPKLYRAATSGDVRCLEQVANANIQLLSKAPQENTALHIAARFGRMDFTKKILQLCSQLFWMKNSDDETALHCAARGGWLDVVKILMDHELKKADHVEEGGSSVGLLRMQNKEGDTALHEALRNKHKKMAIKMVRADPKLPFVVNNAKESSFLLAAKHGMKRVVKEMLSSDGSASRGEQQASASSNSSDTIIPITITSELTTEEKRELVGIQDSTGRTALHYAAWRNNHRIVLMILKIDSHHVPYVADNNGHSPLHVAVAFGKRRSMLELLDHCPDAIEQLDTSGRNVLHIALLNRRYKIARRLLELPRTEGFLNGPDKEGKTPFHLVFQHWEAKPSRRNKDGQTAPGRVSFLRARPKRMPDVTPEKFNPEATRDQQQILVVTASLIATVAFAAAFTLPGGYRSSDEANPGTAILASKLAFQLFVLLDTLSMCLSISAIFFYILSWGPRTMKKPDLVATLRDNGNGFTVTACICMLLALSAGVFATVADESMPLAIVVIVICSLLPIYCVRGWIVFQVGRLQLLNIIQRKIKKFW